MPPPAPLALLTLALTAMVLPGSANRLRAHSATRSHRNRRFVSKCYHSGKEDIPDGKHSSLTLIHIPRTGGSTIEDCTSKETTNSSRWGVHNPDLHGLHTFFRAVEQGDGQAAKQEKRGSCFRQHLPPNLVPEVYRQPGRETFCVVRNPYSRMLSQFGFEAGSFWKDWPCTVADLNRYVHERLPQLRARPTKFDCHLMPQVAHVMGWDPLKGVAGGVDLAQRSCDHVLRFERLTEGFDELMKTKGYPYRLGGDTFHGHHNGHTKSPTECAFLKTEDFDAESRRLIEETFHDDFEQLGYKKFGQ